MIKNWFVSGDCHGDMTRFAIRAHQNLNSYEDKETGYIILGDAGINFWGDERDDRTKQILEDTGSFYYLVRGNHDQRPEHLEDIRETWDPFILAPVLYQPRFPHIYYLQDGYTYHFGDYSALVIGGAYSVDKEYRLSKAKMTGNETYEELAQKALWFADEQLSSDEMALIETALTMFTTASSFQTNVDFVFTHTCPLSWVPTDKFLLATDQSKVDKTMEKWLDHLKDQIQWKIWCFGHYHDDRIERPHVEMYFHDIDSLDTIYNRWYGSHTIDHEWWLVKSPNYYMKGDTPFDYELKGTT